MCFGGQGRNLTADDPINTDASSFDDGGALAEQNVLSFATLFLRRLRLTNSDA